MGVCGHRTKTTDAPCHNVVAPGSRRCSAGHLCDVPRALPIPSAPIQPLDAEEMMGQEPVIPDRWRKPERLSPTSLDTYSKCPKRFELRYIRGCEDPSGPEAVLGTFVHSVLEQVVSPDVPAGERTLERARVAARRAWDSFEKTDRGLKGLSLDAERLREMRQSAWKLICGYFDMENPAEVDVISTERRVDGHIGDVPFAGVIDRTVRLPDGSVSVDDYKTGKAPKEPDRMEKLRQPYLYAAYLDGCDEPVERVRLLYVAAGERLTSAVGPSTFRGVRDSLSHSWERIQEDFSRGSFEPKVGPLCKWCPFADGRCPEGTLRATA